MLLTKEDMIGPEPSLTLQNRLAWTKLQNLIGLEAVKQFVQALFDSIQYNYCRELEENPLVEYSLNRVVAPASIVMASKDLAQSRSQQT